MCREPGPDPAVPPGSTRCQPFLAQTGRGCGRGRDAPVGRGPRRRAPGAKVPDPATASTILGRRVNARAGYALADAFAPAIRARSSPPLSDAAGWACTITGPQPGLVLLDADVQLLPRAPGAGSPNPQEPRSRPAPEPGPGRRVTAQPIVPSPAYSVVPQTEPVFAGQVPQATTHREDLTARNGHTAEIDVAADTASVALDPPTTAAHLSALTALDRRHGLSPRSGCTTERRPSREPRNDTAPTRSSSPSRFAWH